MSKGRVKPGRALDGELRERRRPRRRGRQRSRELATHRILCSAPPARPIITVQNPRFMPGFQAGNFLQSFPLMSARIAMSWIRHSAPRALPCIIMSTNTEISPTATMREVLETFPGAQRALFRRYHIGGCSSCAFSPDETLEQVCQRNGGLNPAEVMEHIRSSHEQDAKVFVGAGELAEWLKRDNSIRLVDVRSREEFEAVHIEGSVLLSQDVMRQIMSDGSNERPLVIVDHQGRQGLDAAAYFVGHGLQNVRCLQGGIDAWAREVEPEMRRYRLA